MEANAAAPEATKDESVKATQAAADAAESGMVSKAELQTQDDKQKRKKEKDRRRRQARRLKAAGAKAEAARDQ